MMGHREATRNGDERDTFSTRCRRIVSRRAGKHARVKVAFNRRIRRASRILVRLSRD